MNRRSRWSCPDPGVPESRPIPRPVRALTPTTGATAATEASSSRRGLTSGTRSTLLSTTSWIGAAVPDCCQVALDAPDVEVPVCRGDDAEKIDIGGNESAPIR